MAAVLVGVVAGAGLGLLGWVNLLTALIMGFCIGSAAFVASARHRDATIQGIAGGAALLGIVLAAVLTSLARASSGTGPVFSPADFFLPTLAAMVGAILRFLF
jgi:predicted permease